MRRSSSIRSIHLAFITDWGNLRSRWPQHPPQIHFQSINQSVAVLLDLVCIGPFSRFRITNRPYHDSYRNIYCYSLVVRSPHFFCLFLCSTPDVYQLFFWMAHFNHIFGSFNALTTIDKFNIKKNFLNQNQIANRFTIKFTFLCCFFSPSIFETFLFS